ncbi:MAG: hypothetical protein WCG80_19660 [Spirochaetales bacterium]
MRKLFLAFEDNSLQEAKFLDVPRTTLFARYDPGNTSSSTQDHLHLFSRNRNELYAINRDGSPHDGSKAQLSGKEIKFLTSLGFSVPASGILESYTIGPFVSYKFSQLLEEDEPRDNEE